MYSIGVNAKRLTVRFDEMASHSSETKWKLKTSLRWCKSVVRTNIVPLGRDIW